MKKYILLFILIWGLLFTTSCLNDYLDKAPESGLTEDEVFTNLANFKLFFDAVYDGRKEWDGWDQYNIKCAFAVNFDFWDQKYGWEGVTDCADGGRYMEGHAWRSGNMSETITLKMTIDGNRRPILESMFTCIRICNTVLPKIDGIKDATDADKNDLRGQAYFIRAFAHFTLFKIWGRMPYLTKPIGKDDVWDIPRLSNHETCMKIAADFDSATIYFRKAGLMRRDPLPGQSGSLNYSTYQMYRPNGMAAQGMKSRVLLYAASPLSNELGVTDWDNAAKAAWNAILCARDTFKVTMLTLSNRYKNYITTQVCEESLWTWDAGNLGWNSGNFATWFCGQFGNSASSWSGTCPTQNWVDKYETKWGEPLNTEADRIAAAAANHFVEQNPYANRDPRLATDVITNQSSAPGWKDGKAQLWYNDSKNYGELLDPGFLGRSFTGYLMRKFWGTSSQSASRKKTSTYRYADPIIRLGELYLNYAEAANEAYGPNVIPPYATKSALTVLNEIRTRAGQPAVLAAYTGSTAALRPRIKNERNVELSFEGHYYFDLRRWYDDLRISQQSVLYGMDIKQVPVSTTYPTGFSYVRRALPADRQLEWKPNMYYMPFNISDYLKMKAFEPNPLW